MGVTITAATDLKKRQLKGDSNKRAARHTISKRAPDYGGVTHRKNSVMPDQRERNMKRQVGDSHDPTTQRKKEEGNRPKAIMHVQNPELATRKLVMHSGLLVLPIHFCSLLMFTFII